MANSRIALISLVEDCRIGAPSECVSSLEALTGDVQSSDPYSQHLKLHQGWLLEEEPGGVRAMKDEHELFFPWTSVRVVRYAPAAKNGGKP